MEAPERIWATPEDGYCTATDIGGDKRDALGFVEYRRADLPSTPTDALRCPEVAELAQALKDTVDVLVYAWSARECGTTTYGDDILRHRVKVIRAALAAIEKPR